MDKLLQEKYCPVEVQSWGLWKMKTHRDAPITAQILQLCSQRLVTNATSDNPSLSSAVWHAVMMQESLLCLKLLYIIVAWRVVRQQSCLSCFWFYEAISSLPSSAQFYKSQSKARNRCKNWFQWNFDIQLPETRLQALPTLRFFMREILLRES